MAKNPTIGYYGEKMDLLIRQGATCGPFLATMVNPDDESRVNLVGCTIRGQVRKDALSSTIAATISVEITDDVNGEYKFWIPPDVTALIPAGETITDDESIYQWDLELEDSVGEVIPLYYGKAPVLREVTR